MTNRELRQTVYTLKNIIDDFSDDLQCAAELSIDVESFDVNEFDAIGVRIQDLHENAL